MEYPFSNGGFIRAKVIEWIADNFDSTSHKRNDRQRVRSAITDAINADRLPSNPWDDEKTFFTWAVTKWPDLRHVTNIPIIPKPIPISAHAQHGSAAMAVISVPPAKGSPELESAYVEIDCRNQLTEQKNSVLLAENESQKNVIDELRGKLNLKKWQGATHGKQGGRGKTK